MKVVDMFGAGLPTLAIHFKSIHELVTNSITGFIFKDSKELFELLAYIFVDWPAKREEMREMRENVLKFRNNRSFE